MRAACRCARRSIRKLQLIARKALQNGLMKYDTLRGYRGPVDARSTCPATGACRWAHVKGLDDVPEWSLAVVLDSSDDAA